MVPGTRATSWCMLLALGACARKSPQPESLAPGEAVVVRNPFTRSEFHELEDVIGVLSWNVLWRLPGGCNEASAALELADEKSTREISRLDLEAELPRDGFVRITVGYFEVPEGLGSNLVKVFLGLKHLGEGGGESVTSILEDPFRSMTRSHGGPERWENDHFVLMRGRGENNTRKDLVLRLTGRKANVVRRSRPY